MVRRLQRRSKPPIASGGIAGDPYIDVGYKVGPRHWFLPDVSITQPGQGGEDYFDGAPQLSVEIVSPTNSAEQIEANIGD